MLPISSIYGLATALAVISTAAIVGSGAASGAPYQKRKQLTCNAGTCSGTFPKVPAKRRLAVETVSCSGFFSANPAGGYGSVFVGGVAEPPFQTYEYKAIGNFLIATTQPVPLSIAAGKSPAVAVFYQGSTIGDVVCTLVGKIN